MSLDADTLRRLSPLLEQALDLEPQQRERWLGTLDPQAAELLPVLRRLLAADVDRETADMLEQRPSLSGLDTGVRSTATDHAPGDGVGPYTLVRELGQGGMGEVWLAERTDGVLKRSVALKLPVLSMRKSVLLQRFARERDILAGLNHQHIARLYDAGIADDGQPYLALEYVQGVPINDYARREGLDARARVALLRQVMDAVQYAHANLVIHRDLKPGNVLVTSEGKALLLDFGIAKLLQEESSQAHETELTRVGGRALTLHYAAPEQVAGLPISIATDVWALGIVLYELLADQRPFEKVDRPSLENALLTLDPSRPSQCASGPIAGLSKAMASDLDTIVLKALKKAPAERYATVSALADDLDRWLRGEVVLAQPDSTWYRTRKFVGRHKVVVITATLAAIVVLAVAAVAVVLGLQAREESARAVAARDFLIDMFNQVDPEKVHFQDVTAKQMLEQGQETILRTLGAQPLLQTDLLVGLEKAYETHGEPEKATQVAAELVRLFEQMGRHRDAALYLMAQAWLGDELGDVMGSEALVARAEKLYPQHASDDEIEGNRLFLLGNLADDRGDYERAIVQWESSLPYIDRALGLDNYISVTVQRYIATKQGYLGRTEPGIARLNDLMSRPFKQYTEIAHAAVLNDQAQLEFDTGQFHASLAHFDDALAQCEQRLDPRGDRCSYSRISTLAAYAALGFDGKALDLLQPLMRLAVDERPSLKGTVTLLGAYRTLAAHRLLEKYPAIAERVKVLASSGNEVKQPARYKAEAHLAQAVDRLLSAQPQAAQEFLDFAKQRIDAQGIKDFRLMARLRLYQSLALQAQGQFEASLALLQPMVAEHAAMFGADHPLTQVYAVHQARALWAVQRRQQAIDLLDHAIPILQQAMGAQAPHFQKIQALRTALARNKIAPSALTRKVEIYY